MRRVIQLLVAAIATAMPAPIAAQSITGRVIEVGSERPVPRAVVAIIVMNDSLGVAEADSLGYFHVALPAAGTYILRVNRLGYARANSAPLTVGNGELVEVVVRLGVSAVPLEPLVVVDRRRARHAQTPFERRLEAGRRSGRGTLITRADLDSARVPSVTSILAQAASTTIEGIPVLLSRGGCRPAYYLNGARMQFASGETVDGVLSPGELEGIEIYDGRGDLPFDLAGPVTAVRSPSGHGRREGGGAGCGASW